MTVRITRTDPVFTRNSEGVIFAFFYIFFIMLMFTLQVVMVLFWGSSTPSFTSSCTLITLSLDSALNTRSTCGGRNMLQPYSWYVSCLYFFYYKLRKKKETTSIKKICNICYLTRCLLKLGCGHFTG